MAQRLHRSQTDKIVAGVCGGLAEYLRIDSTIVRLFFLLLGLSGGIGVVIYLVLWVIIPYGGLIGSAGAAQSGADEMAERARSVGDDVREMIRQPNPKAGILVGGALIVWGVFALIRSLNIPWLHWLRADLLWPILLIVGGVALIWRRRNVE